MSKTPDQTPRAFSDEVQTGYGDSALGGLPLAELGAALFEIGHENPGAQPNFIADNDPRYDGIEP